MNPSDLTLVSQKLPLSKSTLARIADGEKRVLKPLNEPTTTNQDCGSAQSSEPEQITCHEPLAAASRTASYPGRVRVRIESFRTRLIDPDKLTATYFVDCLRYAGIILGDTAGLLDYAIRQEKVASKSDERTEITIEPV